MGATVVTDISWDSVMRLVLLAARQVSKLMALDAHNVRWKVRPYMLVSGTPEVATELPAWKLLGRLLARSSTYSSHPAGGSQDPSGRRQSSLQRNHEA